MTLFNPDHPSVAYIDQCIEKTICCFSCRGYFETVLGTCEPCDELCLTCDGTSTQCLSCREGLHLANGQCKENCAPMSYVAEDGTCRRCAPHCDVCTNFYTCTSE